MNNQTHSVESEDLMCMAYGRQVKELLSEGNPEEMVGHLWEIYSGFISFEKEAGYNARQADIFATFRELVHFCQRIQSLKN